MRTSLNEINTIEEYLDGQLGAPERMVLEGKINADNDMRLNVSLQRYIRKLVFTYWRFSLKQRLEVKYATLKNDPEKQQFNKSLTTLFKNEYDQ